jgi:hypothetical protein
LEWRRGEEKKERIIKERLAEMIGLQNEPDVKDKPAEV